MVSASPPPANILIIGDGLIGLSTALELARRGATCVLIGKSRPGAASLASAGLLVPSVGSLPARVRPFFLASLDRYPAFVDSLQAHDPGLRIIHGLIERTSAGDQMHPRDGAVDNVRLVNALRRAVRASPRVRLIEQLASRVDRGESRLTVTLTDGSVVEGSHVVMAAGAWASEVAGMPRALPVTPLKGQMLALAASPLSRPIMGEDVYLVPRGDETLAGATVEDMGFDISVDPAAIEGLRAAAVTLCPELASAPVARSWAGIRPATPDMLPIIGHDPDWPALLYACGHSKNGVLLAPATASAIADLAQGATPAYDLAPFAIARFGPVSTGELP